MNGWVWRFLLAALVAIPCITSAQAQMCGDTVSGTATLSGDLNCAVSPGLTLGEDARLDMQGHTLNCAMMTGSTGIRLAKGATVTNGKITNCENGIHIQDATGATATRMALAMNTYGINILSSNGAEVVENTVQSCPNGIYVHGIGNKILFNVIEDTTSGITAVGESNIVSGNIVTSFSETAIGAGAGLIKGNVIYGGGLGQFGIYAGGGAKVNRNTVIGVGGTPGVGFLLGNGSKATANVSIHNAGDGIACQTTDSAIKNQSVGNGGHGINLCKVASKNIVTDNGGDGIRLGANASVAKNLIYANAGVGIHATGDGFKIKSNVALGNATDLGDDAITCAANGVWSKNVEGSKLRGCED